MVKFFLKRLGTGFVTLFVILFICFLLFDLIAGSPLYEMIGSRATPETLEKIKRELALDQPFYLKFYRYVSKVFRGDWGESFYSHEKVYDEILERFPRTALLAFTSLTLGTLIGVILGALSAFYHKTRLDRLLIHLSLLGISLPVYWVGICLILVFSLSLSWLPPGGYEPQLQYLILPIIALGMRPSAFVARLVRTEMLTILKQPYIKTAYAKGLSPFQVMIKHILRNVLIPVVQYFAVDLGTLLGGSALVEIVFNYPGIGHYALSAIAMRDYPVILGVVLFSALCFLVINFCVDIINGLIDPRIRIGE